MKMCFLTRLTAVYSVALLLVWCSSLWADSGKDSTAVRADTIRWVKIDEGMEQAKAENKPVVVYFWRSNCGFCRKLMESAFKDTSLIRYVNENSIPVSVNTQSKKMIRSGGRELSENELASKEWLVRSVPCIWLLDSDGCRIKKLTGLRACRGLVAAIKEIRDHSDTPCPNVPLVEPRPAPKSEPAKKP